MKRNNLTAFVISALGFLVLFLIPINGFTVEMRFTVGVVFTTIIWWAFEVMPLPIVALIPLIAMSLSGIIPPAKMLSYYLQPLLFLLIGAFILGSAVLRSGLALRISYYLMTRSWVKGKTRRIGLAFMLAGAIVSSFVSNTATIALFIPIVLSVAKTFSDNYKNQVSSQADTVSLKRGRSNFPGYLIASVLLGVQSSGFAIMIGSPVSVAANGVLEKVTGNALSIYEWAKLGIPISLLVLLAYWFVLNLVYPPDVKEFPAYHELVAFRKSLGTIKKKEWVAISGLFVAMFFWLVVPLLKQTGLTGPVMAHLTKAAYLYVVPIYSSILFFLIPVDTENKPLLQWKVAQEDIGWGIILLVAGALSFSGMFTDPSVALTDFLQGMIKGLNHSSGILLVIASALMCVLLTSFISSAGFVSMYATLTIPMAAALGVNVQAFAIMIGALGNVDFILPSGGAPAATAFSTGLLTIPEMFRIMFACAIAGGLVIMLYFFPFVLR